MWQASELAAFAGVAEAASFTSAAKRLGVPKTAISRAVASLESRLGLKLLERTTRRVALSEAGRLLYPYALRILQETERALDAVRPPESIEGLRVTADAAWGRLLLAPLIPRFLASFPDVPLQVDLVGHGGDQEASSGAQASAPWDVRVCNDGSLGEAAGDARGAAGSRWLRTPLGRPLVILCAAAGFARASPLPASPTELAGRPLLLPVAGERTTLHLQRGSEHVALPMEPRLAVSDPAVVHSATVAGLGIGVLPEFLCRQGLATAKLVRVLPEWNATGLLDLYAECELRKAKAPPVQAFIQFLAANMVPALA